MIPLGAIHLPLKGSAKLARTLGVSHAEAVIGFEFKSISRSTQNSIALRLTWLTKSRERCL